MTAAPMMTAAAAMTEMLTMMAAAVAMTEMFTMMTAAVAMTEMFTMMTAAVAMTEIFTMMTAAAAMTEMFTMMTAAVAMTEMFTMMAAVTDQKPAGKAVVRIVASVVRIGIGIVASVIRIVASVIRIVASVGRIVGVVTVISAPARKQRGRQQSRQNPSPGNRWPPAPDRFQLGKTSYLFKRGAGSKVVHLFGVVFGTDPSFAAARNLDLEVTRDSEIF
jgi:hypothetical protein